MKYFSRYFWFCLSLFVFNQGLEKAGIFIPFVHSYLDDLLCPGIVLGFALSFQQQITYRSALYRFSKWYALIFVLWYSLLFEIVFPSFDSRHHSDVWDVLAYSIGTIGFMNWGNASAPQLFQLYWIKTRSS